MPLKEQTNKQKQRSKLHPLRFDSLTSFFSSLSDTTKDITNHFAWVVKRVSRK